MKTPIAALGTAFLLVGGAVAQPQNNADRPQTIRAGVVVLDADRPSGGLSQSSAPYAFYKLQRASAQRPANWNFVNPLAPSLFDAERAARWNTLRTANGYGLGTIAVNSKISRANAAYWEVFLTDLPESSLALYDVLLVAPRTFLQLNSAEREKLRRFVDKGGTLWVELGALDPGVGIDPINNVPLAVTLDGGSTGAQQPIANTSESLIRRPNDLRADLDELLTNSDFPTPGPNYLTIAPLPGAGYRPLYGGLFGEYGAMQWIAGSQFSTGGVRPQVGLARIGDGQIVITSASIAQGLNGRANYDFLSDERSLTVKGVPAARFLANVIGLADTSRQPSGGSRRNASGLIDVRAPLLSKFRAIAPANSVGTPAIYGGFTAMSFADGTLAVYDTDPNRDLDGDGDPDDGIHAASGDVDDTLRDLSLGQPTDLIWREDLSTPISAPAIAPVVGGGNVVPTVFVTDSAGALRAFRLDLAVRGRLIGSSVSHALWTVTPQTPGGAGAGNLPIPPTVHNGQVYVVDRITQSGAVKARITVVDAATGDFVRSPATGGGPYQIGGPTGEIQIDDPSGAPTIGYIPVQDNSGGMDKILYLPFRGNPSNQNATAGFASIWLGARGERPFAIQPNPESDDNDPVLEVQTRASQQGGPCPLDARTVRLTVLDANGNPYSAAQMAATFSGTVDVAGQPGVARFPFASGVTRLPAGTSVRIDYEIDLGATAPQAQGAFRGDYRLPDNAGVSRRILGNIALTPRGTLVVVSGPGTGGGGGALYSIREEGRGTFRMLSRYELFGEHTVPLNGAGPRTIPEVFFDKDPVNRFLPGMPPAPAPIPRLRNFAFLSGPAIKDNRVYVVAQAAKPFGASPFPVPSSFLMCFDAEPPVPEIPVGVIPENAVVLQPDFGRSVTKTNPDAQSFLGVGPTTYDPDRGMLRLENVAANPRGLVSNALSRSQPIILRVPNQPDRFIEPDAIGAKWSPLLWYYGILGMSQTPGSQPVVVGDTVFVAGGSALPSILAGAGFASVGLINASDAVIAPNDPFLRATDDSGSTNFPYRAWQKQLWTLDTTAGIQPNPHQRWPQQRGLTSFADFVVRLNQTTLPGSSSAFGVAAGEGAALAFGESGLYAFRRGDIVVAEEGRISRVDGSGNLTSSLQAGIESAVRRDGAGGKPIKYVRPTRAYPVGEDGSLLVTDAGANRVALVGIDGIERISISEFRSANVYGWSEGMSTFLKNPQDAVTYSTFESSQNPEAMTMTRADRYLIADTGNRRLIELIQRSLVDASGFQIGLPGPVELSYISPPEINGKSYEFTSVNRVFVPGTGGEPGRTVALAGLANGAPTSAAIGKGPGENARNDRTGSGGLLVLDPRGPAGTQTIVKIQTPDVSAAEFWNPATGTWAVATEPRVLANRAARIRNLAGVKAVTSRVMIADAVIPLVRPDASQPQTIPVGAPYVRAMVTTADAVYEIALPLDGAPLPEVGTVVWQLNEESFVSLRHVGTLPPSADNARRFRPTYARRLDDGDVLVVNNYAGTTFGNQPYQGEVLQIDGAAYRPDARNLGYSLPAVRLDFRSLTGGRGLLNPSFADRR